ncbi:MAG: TIGR03790 family protein [Deltaproteobacteria bacterium]|nr:TIGR03790 family protein [Deltaproteobacteria bacterium]
MALEPKQILVIANGKVPDSVSLSKYYMKKRNIPEDLLLILDVANKERISRKEYQEDVADPVRNRLRDKDPFRFIQCLLTMYGLPLKIAGPEPTAEKKTRLKELKSRKNELKAEIKRKKGNEPARTKALQAELDDVKKEITALRKADQGSSLDSEIALVLAGDYPLESWVPNPYYVGYRNRKVPGLPRNALMVCRLDASTADIVRRVVDDSLAAEQTGLQGKAYFDARWPQPQLDEAASGYRFYDKSIHLAAGLIKKRGLMPVVLNARETLFQPGDCPAAALYCGWYSLANYVDAFQWQPGAVGYHIASSECVTLKREKSRVWCKMMLEKGVAATLGPVGEPYVESFPLPEVFFGLLSEGTLTLAECYTASNPFWSWKMVLIGDPLYRPFMLLTFKHQIAQAT